MSLLGTAPEFPPPALLAALGAVPDTAWGTPQPEHEPTNPGYRLAALVIAGRLKSAATPFGAVLAEFTPVWSAWLAEIPAHGHIGSHIDQGPYRERWHVPVLPAGTFNGQPVVPGRAFPVKHWEPHQFDNPTDRSRIHLVIDRDVILDVTPAPFQRIEDA